MLEAAGDELINTSDGIAAQAAVTEDHIIDLVSDSDDNDDEGDNHDPELGRPSRESKVVAAEKQAQTFHVTSTMKSLYDLIDQVQSRDGSGIKREGRRRVMDFRDMERVATDKTIRDIKSLLEHVEEYREGLEKAGT
jgi:hypothetical protein